MWRWARAVAVVGLVVMLGLLGAGQAGAVPVPMGIPAYPGCDTYGRVFLGGLDALCMDTVTGETWSVPKGYPRYSIAKTAKPTPVNKPSSVLAAQNGPASGADVKTQTRVNAAVAEVNGKAKGFNLWGKAGKIASGALMAPMAYQFGYEAGTVVANFGCSALGWSALCASQPDEGYDPNNDVVVPPDPGWQVNPVRLPVDGGGTTWVDMNLSMLTVGFQYGVVGTTTTLMRVDQPGVSTMTTGQRATATVAFRCVDGASAGGYTFGLDKTATGWKQANQSVYPPFTLSGWASASTCTGHGGVGWMVVYSGNGGTLPVTPLYRVPGDPGYVVVEPDPERHMVVTTTCALPGGGSSTVTATGPAFRETDAEWPALPVPECPGGSVPQTTKVDETGAGVPTKPIYTVDTPPEVVQHIADYPECADGGCVLSLVKIAGADEYGLGDCFDQAGRCTDWFTDPAKATNYQCVYGLPGSQAVVPLSECNIYAPTFNPQDQAKGIGYADPATGETPTPAEPAAGGEPTDGGNCWGDGFSWNPISWVLTPVKCALSWAFVPDHGMMIDAGNMMGDLGGFGVGRWVDAIFGPFGALPLAGGACTTWTEDVTIGAAAPGGGTKVTATFLDPCQGLGLMLATTSRMVSGAAIVVGGAWAAFRAFSSIALNVRVGVGEGVAAVREDSKP